MSRAREFFSAMSNEDRWAYWSDECTLSDIFDPPPSREDRKKICEMVNAWVADPGEHR